VKTCGRETKKKRCSFLSVIKRKTYIVETALEVRELATKGVCLEHVAVTKHVLHSGLVSIAEKLVAKLDKVCLELEADQVLQLATLGDDATQIGTEAAADVEDGHLVDGRQDLLDKDRVFDQAEHRKAKALDARKVDPGLEFECKVHKR